MPVFLKSLKERGYLDNLHVTVCNVGSRKISHQDDYATQGWGVFAPNLTIYGFDADADACDAANAELKSRQINWTEKHIPVALGKAQEERTLYVTKHPMCSSLYPPNESFLNRFAGLEVACLDFSLDIEVTTLDDVCQSEAIQGIDFLQIDVQGADLEVLEGATGILSCSVLAVQIEVEFSPLYVNQPLFADVDTYLRKQDFRLFDLFTSHRPRMRSPIMSQRRSGQLLWGDAIYFRDLLRDDLMIAMKTPKQLLKLACIADVLDFPDYTLEILEYLTLNYGNDECYNFADVIVEGLSQVPELLHQGLDTLPVIENVKGYIKSHTFKADSSASISAVIPPPKLLASPIEIFHHDKYLRHNQRRLEHLASLGLEIAGTTVLEVGAGIGDHTSYFLDRGCQVMSTEGRSENLAVLRSRYPELEVKLLDLDNPDPTFNRLFDIVYCYGLLYHLQKPAEAIEFMSRCCQNMLLLETCVSYGDEELVNLCNEDADDISQALLGIGCRPTRKWIFNRLKQYYDFVYMPITQPNHEQFPLDWIQPSDNSTFTRSIFIASQKAMNNPLLVEGIPLIQRRH